MAVKIINSRASGDALYEFVGILRAPSLASKCDYVVKYLRPWSNDNYATYVGFLPGLSVALSFTKKQWLVNASDTTSGKLTINEYNPISNADPNFIVELATDGPLPANTAAGMGAGKTLTGNATGQLIINGINAVAADIVLIKNELNSINNGVYTVTNDGSTGQYVLTRLIVPNNATPPFTLANGSTVNVTSGSAPLDNTGSYWMLTSSPVTLDSTPLNFLRFDAINGLFPSFPAEILANSIVGGYDLVLESVPITVLAAEGWQMVDFDE